MGVERNRVCIQCTRRAGRSAYCASKHAGNGLVRALAVEWAQGGVTVNAVAPTFVRTPMTEPMFEAFWAHPERTFDPVARSATSSFARMDPQIVDRVPTAL